MILAQEKLHHSPQQPYPTPLGIYSIIPYSHKPNDEDKRVKRRTMVKSPKEGIWCLCGFLSIKRGRVAKGRWTLGWYLVENARISYMRDSSLCFPPLHNTNRVSGKAWQFVIGIDGERERLAVRHHPFVSIE